MLFGPSAGQFHERGFLRRLQPTYPLFQRVVVDIDGSRFDRLVEPRETHFNAFQFLFQCLHRLTGGFLGGVHALTDLRKQLPQPIGFEHPFNNVPEDLLVQLLHRVVLAGAGIVAFRLARRALVIGVAAALSRDQGHVRTTVATPQESGQ